MTIKHCRCLYSSKSQLKPEEIDILLSCILQKNREWVLAHPEKIISKKEHLQFKKKVRKREKGWPIAYLTGEKYFFGLSFKVSKKTLIPRPESEILVETALKIKKKRSEPMILIDVGTGSGCLAISLAKKLPHENIWAIDKSNNCLKIAKENSHRHQVKNILFFKGNLLKPILKEKIEKPILIMANLPYVSKDDFKKYPDLKFEPKSALISGQDGLGHYIKLLKQIKKRGWSQKIFLLLEIDPSQSRKIEKIINTFFKGSKIKIQPDLAGLDRLVIAEINH